MYLHSQSSSPSTWNRGTLETLVSRDFKVCSNDQHLQNEIKQLKKVFRDINGYPNWIIEQTLMLPYKGKVGGTTLKSLRNTLKSVIPANSTCETIYTVTKLASKFNIEDKISKEYKHDLVYKAQCPDLNCNEAYIGGIGRRFSERIIDH